MAFSKIKEVIYHPIGVLKLAISMKRRVISNDVPHIYLLNVPSHGNLGDHIIAVAEKQFFREKFPKYELIIVTSADLYFSIRIALAKVREDDILCMTGGGYLGSMYKEESRFLKILRLFPKNKIIVLPQSIYYHPGSSERKLQKAVSAYQKHSRLFVMAREENTYFLLRNSLLRGRETNFFLTPDMALYLSPVANNPRHGVIWCLRRDAERKTEGHLEVIIRRYITEQGFEQMDIDTYVPRSIPIQNEDAEVERKINDFASSRLVVTDRLHGMIYAAITGTPVIALDNSTGKVSQVFHLWLSNFPYVRFVSDEESALRAVQELLKIGSGHYDQTTIIPKYQPIIDAVNA